jgi:hypothetical protein
MLVKKCKSLSYFFSIERCIEVSAIETIQNISSGCLLPHLAKLCKGQVLEVGHAGLVGNFRIVKRQQLHPSLLQSPLGQTLKGGFYIARSNASLEQYELERGSLGVSKREFGQPKQTAGNCGLTKELSAR